MTIRQKLLLGFASILLLFVLVSGTTFLKTNHVTDTENRLFKLRFPTLEINQVIDKLQNGVRNAVFVMQQSQSDALQVVEEAEKSSTSTCQATTANQQLAELAAELQTLFAQFKIR